MTPTPTVSVIIPAFNEAERIAATIRAAQRLPAVCEVIVVSDGSTDDTPDRARLAGATVLNHPANRGKAQAMQTGAAYATGDLLLFLDADLEATAKDAGCLIAPVYGGQADMTIARFPINPGRGGGAGWVVRAARRGIQHLTGQTMQAPLSGQRCLTRQAWAVAQPLAAGFGAEVGLTVDVLRAGLRVLEVETQMDHRVTGKSAAAWRHRARQGRDVVLALLSRRKPAPPHPVEVARP